MKKIFSLLALSFFILNATAQFDNLLKKKKKKTKNKRVGRKGEGREGGGRGGGLVAEQ